MFSQNLNIENEKERIAKVLDTLDYSESDFNTLKSYYKEQKGFQELVNKKVLEGDENMIDLVTILSLSFNQAKNEYGKREINALIYFHYKSLETFKKFKELNDAFERELDSIEKQKTLIDKHRQEKVHDSIHMQQPYVDKELQKGLDAYKKKMDSLKTKE